MSVFLYPFLKLQYISDTESTHYNAVRQEEKLKINYLNNIYWN